MSKTKVESPNELAADAVNYTLSRIRDDENLSYHAGACTEIFDRLTKAQSALTGIPQEEIEARIFARKFDRPAAATQVHDIKNLIRKVNDHELTPIECLTQIETLLGMS